MREGFINNVRNAVDGLAFGHQVGQWSERRWWGHVLEGKSVTERDVTEGFLLDETNMRALIEEPPFISTPGWGPTGFEDNIPHILGLIGEYKKQGKMNPELFRDYLLASRDWLMPQGVGRSCLELMAEGMNPRIAGLYAASIASGCWVSFPAAFYNAGNPDDAYEEAVSLCRTLNGGDIVELSGAWSAALSVAVMPGSDWAKARAALTGKLQKRNPKAYALMVESLYIGQTASDEAGLIKSLRDESYTKRVSKYAVDWMQSCYAAAAVLEYAFKNGLDWVSLVRAGLTAPDSRFCAMLFCGVYAAIKGVIWPELWKLSMDKIHAAKRAEAVESVCEAAESKIRGELAVAREAGALAGEGGCMDSALYDRMLAGMLSGAMANAMGSYVEDRDYDWIVENHGVVDRIMDTRRFDSEDDAAMAIMWAETLIDCGGRIYPEDLADTFRKKMNPRNFYYDTTHGYDVMTGGLPPHACGHWNVVTGSALMGCNVIGMYHACDAGHAYNDGMELSYHYQRGFDVHAAGILCAATSEALRDGSTIDSVVEAAINAAPAALQHCFDAPVRRDARALLRKMIRDVSGHTDVLAARQSIYESYRAYNGQDPWEVIAYTLAVFKVANGDVWQAALGGTNIGRDSDTIACQAALLTACMKGMDGVPEAILGAFDERTIERYRGICEGVAALVAEKCRKAAATAEALGVSL